MFTFAIVALVYVKVVTQLSSIHLLTTSQQYVATAKTVGHRVIGVMILSI
jgi:hypothetical protein